MCYCLCYVICCIYVYLDFPSFQGAWRLLISPILGLGKTLKYYEWYSHVNFEGVIPKKETWDPPLNGGPFDYSVVYRVIGKTCCFLPGSLLKLRTVDYLTNLGLLGVVRKLWRSNLEMVVTWYYARTSFPENIANYRVNRDIGNIRRKNVNFGNLLEPCSAGDNF